MGPNYYFDELICNSQMAEFQCKYVNIYYSIATEIFNLLSLQQSLLQMLFYLYKSPQDCTSDLESVEAFILERLQRYSLSSALQYDTEDFNYWDRISHLFLCIMAIDYPHFKDSFINGEIKLFQQRLKTVNCSLIKRELSESSEYLSDLMQSEEYKKLKLVWPDQFQLVQDVILAILGKSEHVLERSHLKNCTEYLLTLPFTFPLKLVAKRAVEVKKGKVSLPCGRWSELFEIIFAFLLEVEVYLIENCCDLMKEIYESEDDRLRQIIVRFRHFLGGKFRGENEIVTASEIDHISVYFPPCMAGLHQTLRKSHRLSYDSRLQYTLFLKDIGLSVDENLLFWENEYRRPRLGSSCSHDWQGKGTRYKYQIEHLYGLIGNHGLKSSHPCDRFIQELQPKMDGGCPFQHLTSEELAEAVPESVMALPDVEDIFTFKNRGMPQKACAEYLSRLQRVLCMQRKDNTNAPKLFYIVSPLQFYNAAKNL